MALLAIVAANFTSSASFAETVRERVACEYKLLLMIFELERYFDVVGRVRRLLRKILVDAPEKGPLLLVSHMILVQSLLCIIESRDVSTLRSTPFIEQAKLFHIRITPLGDLKFRAQILRYNGEEYDRTFEFSL